MHTQKVHLYSNQQNRSDNIEKLKLRQIEVFIIAYMYVATGDGLWVDLAKVKVIHNMPSPTDKTGVVQYLSQ